MPAAAVIPAPLAYIKVVAVKKLVVECLAVSQSAGASRVESQDETCARATREAVVSSLNRVRSESVDAGASPACLRQVYLEKIRVLSAGSLGVKALLCLNNVAWNNRIRPRFYSVGLIEQQTSWCERQRFVWVVVRVRSCCRWPKNHRT